MLNNNNDKNITPNDQFQDVAKFNTKEKHKINSYKVQGNKMFAKKEYTNAITLYNKANCLRRTSVIHGNRAAAYIRRAWKGDFYAALNDCYAALKTDPGYVKAHFRIARCLYELGKIKEAEKSLEEFKQQHPEHANSAACNALKKEIREKLIKYKSSSDKQADNKSDSIPRLEKKLQNESSDYKQRFCGHCNTTTDIKEANFFGPNGQYIIAGSDEGSFFIWEKETSNLVRVMQADSSIVNCVQPHPNMCLLATSGIDSCIRLWSPLDNDEINNKRLVKETNSIAEANQKRMRCDPLESMLLSMGIPLPYEIRLSL